MKRRNILIMTLLIVLTGTMALAQQRTLSPQAQQDVDRLLQQLKLQRSVAQLNNPAWWNNTALVTRLGLTDDQKTKIERAFENHKQDLASKTELLQKEEAQLARLLQTEQVDHNAVLSEIDRVIQARGELERVNSAMTLEMREVLTLAQWMQLPQLSAGTALVKTPFGTIVSPGAGGGRGQRQGPGQRQQ